MTFNDFVRFAAEHPSTVILYFTLLPLAALLLGAMNREENHLPPWNYLYSTLLYLVAVPALLSLGMSGYALLNGDGGLLRSDLVLSLLPPISLIATVLIVRTQVKLRSLPGFGGLAGLLAVILLALGLLWVADRVQVADVGLLPVRYVVLIFLVLLFFVRLASRKLSAQ
ncbi:hypothetical protein [Lewinella sp. JB7]|uniref:hypothetical protein n=1 Tax=Lewinella sp. JB7 TaxID=2962887 RepID=UPI0020C9622C|nr:hypothetical protein [Lewinella sp. JB7]MCP9236857.1 hypothetical protein [Lewinella sp. JB7]